MEGSIEDLRIAAQYAPALFRRLEMLDAEMQHYGFNIYICDTDHTYDSFRWWVVHSDQNTIGDDKNHNYYDILSHKLDETIKSTCCLCGSTHYVTLQRYDAKNSSSFFHHKCAVCQAKEMTGYEMIYGVARVNFESKRDNVLINIPHIKVRLINNKDKVFYEHLPNIFLDNNELYVSNHINLHESVRYGGVDLGIRTDSGERVYEGDLVMATIDLQDHLVDCWGMALQGYIDREEDWKLTNHIVLFHGWNNFVSPLRTAVSIKVVGNVLLGHEQSIDKPDLRVYYEEYFDDFEKLFAK